jgi:hypothetical protein
MRPAPVPGPQPLAPSANGLRATVFNPAGLHKNTLKEGFDYLFKVYKDRTHHEPTPEQQKQFRQDMQKRITVFATRYEALTTLQDKWGLAGLIMPHTYGTVHELNVGDWYEKMVDHVQIGRVKVLALPIVRDLGEATVGVEKHLMDTVLRALGEKR